MYIFVSIFQPAADIEIAEDFDLELWEDQKDKLDHGYTI